MAKTAGNGISWAVIAGLGLAVTASPAGCAPIESEEGEAAGVKAVVLGDVLAQVGPSVIEPTLARYIDAAGVLGESLAAWEADGANGSSAHVAVQDAWVEAMLVWHELEVMQVGPAASSLSAVGGADVRDEVYSWPTVNGCRVDQETVTSDWLDAGYFEANVVNSYGLDAVERLAYAGLDNDCPSQVDINANGTWSSLSESQLVAQRAGFGQALVAHTIDAASELAYEWSADGGGFGDALGSAATSGPYSSEQEALNAVYDALFFVETMVKDRKLAQPLGLRDCSTGTCPDDAEHLESGLSALAIGANLRGFRLLFTGGDDAGIDDLLAELGHSALSDEILAACDIAIATAEATDGRVDDLVDSNPDAVQTLHDDVKALTDLLKGDLVTVLQLTIPAEAAGDND